MLTRSEVRVFLLVVGALILLGGVVGCDSGSNLPPLVEVTGQVTVDGKPVTTGVVAFTPDKQQGGTGPMSSGGIDETGHYALKTVGEPGATAGWHVVTVEAIDQNSQSMAALVSPKYARPETSPLRMEVKPGEKNVINLELKSNP